MTNENIAHLPRSDVDETFCGLKLTTGVVLSSTITAAECDKCIRTALAENAVIKDRREKAQNLDADFSLGQLFAILANGGSAAVAAAVSGEGAALIGGRAFEKFALEQMKDCDAPEYMQQMLEVPAFVASEPGYFPWPASAVLSMLTFYLAQLDDAVKLGRVTPEEANKRIDSALCITELIEAEHSEESRGKEWPMTVDCWLGEGWDKK